MHPSRPDDQALAELLTRARAGDRQAESALMEALQPTVRAYFFRRVGDHAELDDLVQNTLVRVFRGIAEIKNIQRVRAFTLKAALFELQDLYRGRYGSREATVADEIAEPGVRPMRSGLNIDIERALAALTPNARRIIELKALGYRYEEIADMVETTEAAVKMQVKRALEKLRSILGVLTLLFLPVKAVLLLLPRLIRLLF
ncbi:MAG: RNA polymerase sigma-70 factor (ECF subfamily) [Rhodothermales bacterium]|jgi:RNA polymerase sigma-70 factor (ECF subfamily)